LTSTGVAIGLDRHGLDATSLKLGDKLAVARGAVALGIARK
jgi:hypothetical protein